MTPFPQALLLLSLALLAPFGGPARADDVASVTADQQRMAKLQPLIANAEVIGEQKVQLLTAYAPQVLLASGENTKTSSVDRMLATASAGILSQAGAVSQAEDGDDFHYAYTRISDDYASGEYILAGAYKDKDVAAPPQGWPVVLVYHGGSRNAEEILKLSKLGHLAAVVISLQGQESHNGLTWMNAFPWLKSSREKQLPRDDIRFTELVLEHVSRRLLRDLGDQGKLDRSRIYATGKSDGGGMAVFLAAHHELRKFEVRAIAPISGAYFGVEQKYDTQDYILPPKADDYRAIVLAKEYIPVLEMHGTKDPVMPYLNKDKPFHNPKALERSEEPGAFWSKDHGFAHRKVAYTADIPSYWKTWAEKVNGAQLVAQQFWKPSPHFKLHVYLKDRRRPLQHIEVVGGAHQWFGHTGDAASCTIDATMVIANFFEIPLIKYKSPVVPETPKLPYVSSSP
jgi:poly(3-hydroxybutyrate) depolymerase